MNHKPTSEDMKKRIQVLEKELSETRQTLEKLRESEARHRFFTEQMSDTVWTLDLNMKPTYVSAASKLVLGFSPEERMKQNLSEMVTPDTYARITEMLAVELQNEIDGIGDPDRVVSIEMEYYHKDGHTVWLENKIRAIRDGKGRLTGILGVSRSINDRKRAEQALRKAEQRFLQVTENSREIIWEVDQEGLYLYCSPAVERILGHTPEELVGKKHFYDLFVPQERESLIKAALDHFNGRKSFRNFVNPNLTKDGKLVILETSGTPMFDENGNLIGYRGVDMDVTERKRSEEEREKLIIKLQQALSEVKTLSGLLPICSSCKKIRDDKGYWNQIELYITTHSKAEFSHGLCPECAKKLYPELYEKD